MLDDSMQEQPQPKNHHQHSEAYTVAQSIILGLVIASVAIGVGPIYGSIVALGGAVATLIAGATLADEDEMPPIHIRLPSRARLQAMRQRFIAHSPDEGGR